MKKLHLTILRSFVGPFFMSFLVVLFILVLQFLARYMEEISGKDVEAIVFIKLFIYCGAFLLTLALPLGVLLSSLMTMGNMGERYELAAIKSAGISLFRVIKPMFLFTVALTIFSLYFSFFIVPKANLKFFSLLYDLSKVKPSFALKKGHFYSGIDGYTIHVADLDRKRDMLYSVKIFDHTNKKFKGNQKIVVADSARMYSELQGKFISMQLFHGVSHEYFPEKKGEPKSMQYGRYYFDTLNYHFQLSGFEMEETEKNSFKPHQYMKDIFELRFAVDSMQEKIGTDYVKFAGYIEPILKQVDSTLLTVNLDSLIRDPDSVKAMIDYFPVHKQSDLLKKAINNCRTIKNYATFTRDKVRDDEKKKRKYQIELHTRIYLPLSCIVFLFIGAPLGAIVRKGGIGLPVLFSVGFFVFFYILSIQGKKFAQDGIMLVWAGVYLPLIVMTPMAILLTFVSSTDSRILELSLWTDNFRNLIDWFKDRLGKGKES